MTRQEARAAGRALSKIWVNTRISGSRAKRKELAKQIANGNWRALLRTSSSVPITQMAHGSSQPSPAPDTK